MRVRRRREVPADTAPVALWVWYVGGRYRGYQAQLEGPTVQQTLEEGLRRLGGGTAVAAGRTDLGVHARMQVVRTRLPAEAMDPKTLGGVLPPDLGVAHVRPLPRGFHPQWSAAWKEYRYRFSLRAPPGGWQPFTWNLQADPAVARSPSLPVLEALLRACEGTRDFIAFHERSSPQRSRTLTRAALTELGGGSYEVSLRGDAFARYQVRYLVGSAVAVAAGRLEEDRFLRALERGEPLGGLKAPAAGLVLWEVGYPAALDPFGADRARAGVVPSMPPFSSDDLRTW